MRAFLPGAKREGQQRVDLTRSLFRRGMSAVCAKRPPADWVLTLVPF